MTNPNKIAATIDNNLRAIPKGTYPPSIEGAEDQLRSGTWQHARRDYGNPCRMCCKKRLKKELDSICGHGYAVLYVIAVKLVAFSTQAATRWAAVALSAPALWRTFPAFRRSTPCRRTTCAPSASTASGLMMA